MITGAVKSDEARIRLTVKGWRGREQKVEAVIDSGFTGALTSVCNVRKYVSPS